MSLSSAGGGLPTEDISDRSAGLGAQDLGSSVNPHASIDDYNRVMLQYTQRQMAAFTNSAPGNRRSSGNSGSSGSSGQSNTSSIANMARTSNGPPPRRSGTGSHS
ncbi:hypothetical protein PISL3812_04384 [Talaromyces islandicus]|uniref:Uncharacterized protein n=1 Tax=Talaromyces islandicus TaxID=28573 RepID=A0A0U1LVE0_TALIS|nr:hypothetical protein PISL3812_04384 [Talaromyces islandicus]